MLLACKFVGNGCKRFKNPDWNRRTFISKTLGNMKIWHMFQNYRLKWLFLKTKQLIVEFWNEKKNNKKKTLGVAYPMISRWGWYSSGWLKVMGYRDFGGSGTVHLFSGVCAVVAAQMIGPRDGRFTQLKKQNTLEQQANDIPGHSLPVSTESCHYLILVILFGNPTTIRWE